jgi:protein-tyrosine phosphatase
MKYYKIFLWIIWVLSIVFQSCTDRDTPQYSDTWINLQSVQNARQLGGYPTKSNRVVRMNAILRTGELAFLSNTDKSLLINEYRLAHIIDLRDEVEVADNPDPLIEGVQYHHLIVWTREVRNRNIQESTTDWGFDADLFIKNYYTAFALEPAAIEAFKKMFETLLKNETGSVLIHCVHGKDRSGVAAALIFSALDVAWSVIEYEYLLSNTPYPGSVDISSLRYYKSVIEKNYGSIEKYLETEMELDENDLMALREKYTTE